MVGKNKMEAKEVLVWTPELEVSLFHSMKGHKPIGINKRSMFLWLLEIVISKWETLRWRFHIY
jgi:hypothetical protein